MKLQIFFLAIVAALFWGTAPLFEKTGLKHLSPEVGLAVRSIVITIGILSVVLATGHGRELVSVDRRSALYMAIGAILSGFIGQFFYFYVLKADQASRVVPLIAGVYPLVAAVLAITVLREPFTVLKAIGAVLVVTGAVLLRLK